MTGAIKDFIYETLGYSRIQTILEGKNDVISVRRALEGTILSTFATEGRDGRSAIHVPGFHTSDEILALDDFLWIKFRRKKLGALDSGLVGKRYILATAGAFCAGEHLGRKTKRVADYFGDLAAQIRDTHFPGAQITSYKVRNDLGMVLEAEGALIYAGGSNQPHTRKCLIVGVNLPDEEVSTLNELHSKYMKFVGLAE